MKAIYLGDSGSQLQKMKHSLHKFLPEFIHVFKKYWKVHVI